MFQTHEEFANARQHLHLLQTKVEKMLTLLLLQFDLWNDNSETEPSLAELLQLCEDFEALLQEHYSQVCGDGLLERAVTNHPSLGPVLRDVEKWQAAILRDLHALIAELKTSPVSAEQFTKYRESMRRLQSEILAEEIQERHLMERGWT